MMHKNSSPVDISLELELARDEKGRPLSTPARLLLTALVRDPSPTLWEAAATMPFFDTPLKLYQAIQVANPDYEKLTTRTRGFGPPSRIPTSRQIANGLCLLTH